MKLSKQLQTLKGEYQEINKLMKKLQTQYYKTKSLGPKTYQLQKEHYLQNKIEIEEDIAILEARLVGKVFLPIFLEKIKSVKKVIRK